MKKYDVHVEYANAPATDVEDAECVLDCKDEFVISKGNRKYHCNRAMITCITVTEKEPYEKEGNNSDKSGWDPLWDGRITCVTVTEKDDEDR